MRCGHCGTTVADGFKVCPACHAVHDTRFTQLGQYALVWGVVALVAGAGLLGIGAPFHVYGYPLLGGIAGIALAILTRKQAWWRANA